MQRMLVGLGALLVVAEGAFVPHPFLPRPSSFKVNVAQDSCDFDKLATCSLTFVEKFGGPQRYPTSAQDFAENFLAVLFENVTDPYAYEPIYKNICQWFEEMEACGGADVFPGCMTIPNFIHLGFSATDAVYFLELNAQWHYVCGEAYDVMFNNWDCIQKAANQSFDQLEKCAEELTEHLQHDYAHLCKWMGVYMNCAAKPYTQICGADVGHFMCEGNVVVQKVAYPQCDFQCDNGKTVQRFKNYLHL